MWVARDKDGKLHLFNIKPYKNLLECDSFKWYPDIRAVKFKIDSSLFPDLTWEDEPLEVNLAPLCSISISEEKISKLAWEYADSIDIPCRYEETALESYKVGCRKMLELLNKE